MRDWKTVGKKFLFPPFWLILLLSVCSAVALTVIFLKGWEEHPIAYGIFAVSAYTVTVLTVYCIRVFPTSYRKTKHRIYAHPFGNRYLTDATFKVRISLYISLSINLLYAAFKVIAGILYGSIWLGAVAVYYIVLSVLRFLLIRYMHTDATRQGLLSEYRRYRLCGILMLLLNLSLTGIVFQMVWRNEGYSYPELVIFAVAAYTFYSVTISIVDLVRYRKYKSPVLSASKAIRFASALVSLLSLETAMLAQFGEDDTFRRTMTAATGAGVCVTVLGVSVYIIVRSCRAIGTIKRKGAILRNETAGT